MPENNQLPEGYYSDESSIWVGHPDKDKATLVIGKPKEEDAMPQTAEEIARDIVEDVIRKEIKKLEHEGCSTTASFLNTYWNKFRIKVIPKISDIVKSAEKQAHTTQRLSELKGAVKELPNKEYPAGEGTVYECEDAVSRNEVLQLIDEINS